MEERRLRIGSLFEWLAAALVAALILWVVSGPVQRLLGPGVQAAIVEVDLTKTTPAGVPAGALLVPVLLMDGKEVRQGDLQSKLDAVLPTKFAEGQAVVTRAQYGDRITRAYVVHGARFFVVSERMELNGPLKVAGIYLP